MQFITKSLLPALTALGLVAAASAGTKTFDNNGGSGDGKWHTAANWDPEGVPQDGDDVIIQDGKTCTLDTSNGRAESLDVNGTLVIDAVSLEIDANSDVEDAQGIQLKSSGSVLKALQSLTFSGAGSIDGRHDAARMDIAGDKTLTSTTTIEGQLQIKGLASGSPFGSHGQFVNNGTVHANVASGKILVVGNSLLGAGTGEWKVDTASAVLEFDAGSACGTEIGDLTFDAGSVQIDADVTFNAFHWDGGTINGTDTKRMRYETFSSDTGKGNPNDGTQSCGTTYFYVDDYPKS